MQAVDLPVRTVSIVSRSTAAYDNAPGAIDSPQRMVQDAIAAWFGETDVNARSWNPLGRFVGRGERVHILPNFVSHRREFERTERDFLSKVTHASVVQPLVELALRAVGSAGHVTIGNAPIQGCDFARIRKESGLDRVMEQLPESERSRVEIADLRGLRTKWSVTGALLSREETEEDLVEIDLGADSLLEPLYETGLHPRFRVGDYNPRETESYHAPGRHVYVVNRRVLNSTLVISVPKLKTHEKVGLTCALKGTVGIIGRKECLAHHRMGGPGSGGDEFPGDSRLYNSMSELLDVGAAQPISLRGNLVRIVGKTLFRAVRKVRPGTVGGGWSGNDTAWRMALDIARVLRHAGPDGTLASTPQRSHIVVIDGIISGEGNGPLRPRPVDSGVVLFGADPCAVDWACGLVMGHNPTRFPIVREAFSLTKYPLTEARAAEILTVVNGKAAAAQDVQGLLPRAHALPDGWVNPRGKATG